MKINKIEIKEMPHNKLYYVAVVNDNLRFEYKTYTYDRISKKEFKDMIKDKYDIT